MTRWKLTVFVAQGSTPVVTKLIDLAERRPLMSGNEMTEAIFAYDTEMDAREASRRIEGAGLGGQSVQSPRSTQDPRSATQEMRSSLLMKWRSPRTSDVRR